MYNIKFYKKASQDYINIWEYIWKDNLFYSNKVLKNIDETIETILLYPKIWREINFKYRFIVEYEYKYKIVYKIKKDTIYIVSIFKYQNIWD